MSTRVIASYKDFPYGSYTETTCDDSGNGFPPLLNPERGYIYTPQTQTQYKAYPALANKLTRAINAVIPEETHALVRFDSRTSSSAVLSGIYGLSNAAFKLDYYIDSNHPLLKIATLTDFYEFKAAVLAL